jgi:hypothetical protein
MAFLSHYLIEGQVLDSVELKTLLLTRGIKVHPRVYRELSLRHRISRDPLEASSFHLPDGTVVHLVDLSFHLGHLRQILKPGFLKQLSTFRQIDTPFRLLMDKGAPTLFHKQHAISPVIFPPATDFYGLTTPSGLPVRGNAVLQGSQWVSFQCLWHCEYAARGEACQFCHAGAEHRALAQANKPMPRVPSPEEAAWIVKAAVDRGLAQGFQLTGGSTFQPQGEIGRLIAYLDAIFRMVPAEVFACESLIYTTPPTEPQELDHLIEHGAQRIALSLEVWDEALCHVITPGKVKFTTRERHLRSLEYLARKYGPNKACCNFVVGVEPVESFLKGAKYMAERGIVPIASVWIPFGMPVAGRGKAPGIDYYRRAKEGLVELYHRHGINPPGGMGLNVCMCRDVALHAEELADPDHPKGCLCYGACGHTSSTDDGLSIAADRIRTTSNLSPIQVSVLGSGCGACGALAQRVRKVLEASGRPFVLEIEDDIAKVIAQGAGGTPGLVVNGRLQFWGRVPPTSELSQYLFPVTPGAT